MGVKKREDGWFTIQTATIRCELNVVSLNDGPAYTALSYVWGNPKDTVPIVVQGCSFQATKNLVAAMRRLRTSNNPLTVWIDAICINQNNNLDEKTQQIMLMGSIYENASAVAVFLGESGILDIVPAEDMEAWLDAPRQEWHRDATQIVQSSKPPLKAFVGRPQTKAALAEYIIAELYPQWGRADPKEHPMWATFDPLEGIKDQAKIDTFFQRQLDIDYGKEVDDACQLFRESQEGAFAILNQLSNGRCLKSCLRGSTYSVAWMNALKVIEHVSELPWWSRVWIMQESILPQGRIFAVYGENRTDSIELFEDSGSIIPRHHERGHCCEVFWDNLPAWQREILRRFGKLMDPFNFIRDIDNMLSAHPLDRLHHLVGRARHLGATDARDKIFGLLGLALHAGQQTSTDTNQSTVSKSQQGTSANHREGSSRETRSAVSDTFEETVAPGGTDPTSAAKIDTRPDMLGIVPDYKQTTTEVYTSFALRVMLHEQHLGLLAAKERVPVGLEDLPSWVPKWLPLADGTTDYLTRERMRHFMACHSNSMNTPSLVNNFALPVIGLRFDKIVATTRPFYQDVTHVSKALQEIQAFFGLDVDPQAIYHTSIPLADAVWRTMVGDLLYYIDKELKSDTIKFRRVRKADIEELRLAKLTWDGITANVTVMVGEEPNSTHDSRMMDFAETARKSFWYASEARLFFKTERGYIGSAPADAIVGDEIATVEGSLVPLLLRQTEPVATLPLVKEGKLKTFDDFWFKFVGCPYVCGIMDGEAGPGQSVESNVALKQRVGDVYSCELHMTTLKALQDGKFQKSYLFLA